MPRSAGGDGGRKERTPVAIFAAGGLLWRPGAGAPLLAVVHRPRYDDWALPKGKLDPGERFPEAAIREVREETGCEAELAEFAGADAYALAAGTKVVLYWHMRLVREVGFEPGEEIDAVDWLSVEDALKRLDHAGERKIVREAADAADWVLRPR